MTGNNTSGVYYAGGSGRCLSGRLMGNTTDHKCAYVVTTPLSTFDDVVRASERAGGEEIIANNKMLLVCLLIGRYLFIWYALEWIH